MEPYADNIPKGCVTYFSPGAFFMMCPGFIIIYTFDLCFLGHLNKFQERRTSFTNKAITYLTFSPNGNELLVNMGGEQIYLYDINNAKEPDVIYTFRLKWQITLEIDIFFSLFSYTVP